MVTGGRGKIRRRGMRERDTETLESHLFFSRDKGRGACGDGRVVMIGQKREKTYCNGNMQLQKDTEKCQTVSVP